MKKISLLLSMAFLSLSSCELVDKVSPDGKLGGEPSPMGEVGNTFSLGSIAGVADFSGEVTEFTDGISTVKASITITDPQILNMAKSVAELNWNGNTATVSKKYRITDEGIQNVYDEGNYTLVKYDGKVGDEYSIKVGGKKYTRTIDYKSTEDEYQYAFWNIKVIKVVETGRPLIGVSKLEYLLNHKFGIVGFKVYFEDGSEKEVRFFSKNDV
ncbi:hypothetical protein [Jiulongibacter sediminis]|nr:hypothetical protein [Jiulongibacter sediminis]